MSVIVVTKSTAVTRDEIIKWLKKQGVSLNIDPNSLPYWAYFDLIEKPEHPELLGKEGKDL